MVTSTQLLVPLVLQALNRLRNFRGVQLSQLINFVKRNRNQDNYLSSISSAAIIRVVKNIVNAGLVQEIKPKRFVLLTYQNPLEFNPNQLHQQINTEEYEPPIGILPSRLEVYHRRRLCYGKQKYYNRKKAVSKRCQRHRKNSLRQKRKYSRYKLYKRHSSNNIRSVQNITEGDDTHENNSEDSTILVKPSNNENQNLIMKVPSITNFVL